MTTAAASIQHRLHPALPAIFPALASSSMAAYHQSAARGITTALSLLSRRRPETMVVLLLLVIAAGTGTQISSTPASFLHTSRESVQDPLGSSVHHRIGLPRTRVAGTRADLCQNLYSSADLTPWPDPGLHTAAPPLPVQILDSLAGRLPNPYEYITAPSSAACRNRTDREPLGLLGLWCTLVPAFQGMILRGPRVFLVLNLRAKIRSDPDTFVKTPAKDPWIYSGEDPGIVTNTLSFGSKEKKKEEIGKRRRRGEESPDEMGTIKRAQAEE